MLLLIIISAGWFVYGKIATNQLANHEYKEGDIVFQTTNSDQCKAVQLATHSPYSHCGILFKENKSWHVLEAVGPVKVTPLDEWIEHGVDHKYVVKRLKNAEQVLTTDILKKMRREGDKFIGQDYDFTFEWSDQKIYCSELVWKIYKRGCELEVGKLSRLKDFDLSHPIVKTMLNERYGQQIPLEEIVIPPSSIFESEALITVFKN